MTFLQILALGVFFIGYLGITLEHKLHINKSAWALALAGILWIIVAAAGIDPHLSLEHTGSSIFEIIVFLLAAMSLVEILAHYRFFDVIKIKLIKLHLSERGFFIVLSIITFILSGLIDNLTTAIVMIQISRKFFWEQNLLIAVVGVVIAANAGGAFSPIGDITTIMLWLADKFTTGQIITQGILPSIGLFIVATLFLSRKIKPQEGSQEEATPCEALTRSEKIVITVASLSFLLPLVSKAIGLTPVIGILLGVGVTWITVDLLRSVSRVRTHLTASIENLIQKIDVASLKFFVGILLAVGALEVMGILEKLSAVLFPAGSSFWHIVAGNGFLGIASALFDNIPLTAIAIDIIPTTDPSLWVLLAITVGTGGSLLSIGSAAGVIAMGMVPKLTFVKYFKLAFVPALAGYVVAIGIWVLQVVV